MIDRDRFGNYLLHGIEEIHLPEPLAWWPLAPGWQLLGLLLLLLGLYRALRHYRAYRHNRYRREALQAMIDLRRRLPDPEQRLRQLPLLLRAVALKAYPRNEVAALSGEAWLRFLDRHCPAQPFAGDEGQALLRVSYQDAACWQLDDAGANALEHSVRDWILGHQEPDDRA